MRFKTECGSESAQTLNRKRIVIRTDSEENQSQNKNKNRSETKQIQNRITNKTE